MHRSGIFIFAVLITVAWLSIIVWWLTTTPIQNTPSISFSIEINETTSEANCQLWQPLCPIRVLSLNEAGDFLAGAFSVLAFLWLATAVLLQGVELKRQRIEFEATRKAIEKQTVSMLQSAAAQEMIIQDKRMIGNIEEILVRYSETWPSQLEMAIGDLGPTSEIQFPEIKFSKIRRNSSESTFRGLCRDMLRATEDIPNTEATLLLPENLADFEHIVRMMKMEVGHLIERQEFVSSRYASSNLFSDAVVFVEVCNLLLNTQRRFV